MKKPPLTCSLALMTSLLAGLAGPVTTTSAQGNGGDHSSRFRELLDSGKTEDAVRVAVEAGEPLEGPDLDRILEVWSIRQFDLNVVEPLVMASITGENFVAARGTPEFVGQWLRLCFEQGGLKSVEGFLEKLAGRLLGPKAKRRDFIAANYEAPVELGTPKARIELFEGVLRTAHESEPLLFPTVDLGDELGLSIGSGWRLQQRLEALIYDDLASDRFLEVMKNSPFIGTYAGFEIYPRNRTRGGSVLSMLIAGLRGDRARASREKLLEHLGTIKPTTFGSGLLLACFDDRPSEVLYRHLGTFRQEIEAQNLARTHELAKFVAVLDEILPDLGELGEEAAETRRWLERIRFTERDEKIAKILAATRYQDLPETPNAVLPELVVRNRAAAIAVFKKIVTLTEAEYSPVSAKESPTDRSLASTLLTAVVAALPRESLHRGLFVQDLVFGTEGAATVELTESNLKTCDYSVRWAHTKIARVRRHSSRSRSSFASSNLVPFERRVLALSQQRCSIFSPGSTEATRAGSTRQLHGWSRRSRREICSHPHWPESFWPQLD